MRLHRGAQSCSNNFQSLHWSWWFIESLIRCSGKFWKSIFLSMQPDCLNKTMALFLCVDYFIWMQIICLLLFIIILLIWRSKKISTDTTKGNFYLCWYNVYQSFWRLVSKLVVKVFEYTGDGKVRRVSQG